MLTPAIFSEDTFKKLKGDNKELMIIPDAVHTDLYDRTDIIPFDKLEEFLQRILKIEGFKKKELPIS